MLNEDMCTPIDDAEDYQIEDDVQQDEILEEEPVLEDGNPETDVLWRKHPILHKIWRMNRKKTKMEKTGDAMFLIGIILFIVAWIAGFFI